MMNEKKEKKNLKSYMLSMLVLTFLAPIGAAYWLYYAGGTETKVNRGEFVEVGVQLMDMNLLELDGNKAAQNDVFGHWHMMFFMNADCDKKCEETIYTMRQIKTSFHKESTRITNMLIHFDKNISNEFKEKIKTHYTNFDRYYADKEVFNQALGYAGNELVDKNIIFIVDPIGNVILKYNKDKTAKDIMQDMKRLLKASHIG
ncbi:MAG: SCO family protein [Gammaproteobacteria bacterium]|nr:SCO family protein [Gammaproteobacteria bacterium]